MDKTKELTKLARQAIKIAEGVSESKIEQLKAASIDTVATISNTDANVFSQCVFDRATEMEKQGKVEVEVQYTTNILNTGPAGSILVHCALLIGRKYADSSVR